MEARRKGRHLLWIGAVSFFMLACFFSGAFADIPDGVVYTDLHKTVLKGNTTILKCEFYGDPIAVYWKKGDNPEQGTNLISWVEGGNPSGSCVTDNACDMGDHYSLIIRDARISDQGRYICRVSNYLGILIHNYTDVKIYAPPTEPFPVIDECVESGSSTFNSRQPCSVLSNGSIVISCTVLNYYPDLDLFFLHGSQKIMDAEINEGTNIDGTKNKAVSIKVLPSGTPYVCVASDIPGSNDQRATTILVKSLRPTESTFTPPLGSSTSSATKGGKMNTPNDNKAAKIAVPIVVIMFIAGICIVLFLAIRRWKAHKPSSLGSDSVNKDPEEQVELLEKAKIDGRDSATIIDIEEQVKANIDGDISFYELWSLAYETRVNEKMRIHQVLTKLNIKDVTEGLSSGNIYDLLCKWKEEKQTNDLAELLKEALASADLKIRWLQLCELRQRADSKVSQETLKQIILEIGNPDKIQQFLGELIPNRPIKMDGKGEGKGFIEEATEVMREWSKGPFEENPFASLSLALERSGCSPLDRTFFGEIISFFELWSLSHYLKDYDTEGKHYVFEDLGLLIEDRLTREELYDLLCSWKDSSNTISQGKCLRDALDKANLRKRWKDMKDLRRGDNTEVSQHTLEHILWHIKDPKKIDQFMQRLTLNDPGMLLDTTRGLRGTIQEAMTRLNIWAKKGFDENPFVLLSLALEKTGCCPIDRTFLKVPHVLTKDIEEIKVQSFVDSLTSRHIKALAKCFDIGKTEDTMTRENKETIFNTESMISDWIAQEECSNYEKKWKLNKAVNSIGRQDLKGFFGEIKPAIHIGMDYESSTAHIKDTVQGGKIDNQTSDFIKEEYQRIATYLSPSQNKNLFGYVGDSGDPRAVQSYAEHQMAKKSKKDLRGKLREKLKSAGLQDLIPSELEHSVYLCEFLDVAFRLILEDVYPFAKALGISDEKLQDYRVNYSPHHLTKGTTAILIKLSEANNNDRSKVCQALSHAGYTDIVQLLEYGHEISLADEFAVASSVGSNRETLVKISQNLRMSEIGNMDTVLRDWKGMVHPPSYNHRTSLADAVFPVLGVDVAIAILSGKYRNSSKESPAFLKEIIRGIESFERPLISTILSANDEKKSPDQRAITQPKSTSLLDKRRRADGDKGLPVDDFTKSRSLDTKEKTGGIDKTVKSAIAHKLAQILDVKVTQHPSSQEISTRQVLETWEKKTQPGKIDRRKLSDDLLRAGFKEFAFEIMTGSVPSKKSKLPWKKDKQQKVGKQEKLPESDENDEQASDDNEEQDNKDNVEPAIKNSVDRYIEDVQQAIKDNGGRVIKEKSSDSSRAESGVQANLDSDDSGTTGSDELEIKDAGNQGIINSGDCAIKEHSDPLIRNNNDSDHTASGNRAVNDSINPAIKDNRVEVVKSSGARPTDSVVRASTNSDDPATKAKDDSDSKDSGNRTPSDIGGPAIKVSSDPPSETRMKEPTQAASNGDVQASTITENGGTNIKDSDNQTTNGGDS